MYIYIYSDYIHVHIPLYTGTCTPIYRYMYPYIHVHIPLYTFTYTPIYRYIHPYIHVHIPLYTGTYTPIYRYIHPYIHVPYTLISLFIYCTYIHVYIHVHIPLFLYYTCTCTSLYLSIPIHIPLSIYMHPYSGLVATLTRGSKRNHSYHHNHGSLIHNTAAHIALAVSSQSTGAIYLQVYTYMCVYVRAIIHRDPVLAIYRPI